MRGLSSEKDRDLKLEHERAADKSGMEGGVGCNDLCLGWGRGQRERDVGDA